MGIDNQTGIDYNTGISNTNPGRRMDRSARAISFHFQPFEFDKGNFAVEKDEGEGKTRRRYLTGIASGLKTDAHGERMTEKCIKSFMAQSNSGDILLYPDVHGIKASEDIGKIVKAEVLPGGDWKIDARLYDDDDGIGEVKKEKISDIWKQCTGSTPYKKPIQKGFSIEGSIPDGGILEAEKDEAGALRNRVIDDIQLDGVVLVPRPAYKDSIAHAVFKALGEMAPWKREKVTKGIADKLREQVRDREQRDNYFRSRWDIQSAFDEIVEAIMKKKDTDIADQLATAFDEYKKLMTELILNSADLFVDEEERGGVEADAYGSGPVTKSVIYRALLHNLENLQTIKVKKARSNR